MTHDGDMGTEGGPADRVIRFLVTHAHCAECGGRYRLEDVYVLEQMGMHVWDLAAVCHQCYTLSVVRAVVRPHARAVAAGDSPAPRSSERLEAVRAPSSELTAAEMARFAAMSPLGVDDVLDVSTFLTGFDGDFRALFSREPDAP